MRPAVAQTERRLAWLCVLGAAGVALIWPPGPNQARWIALTLALLPLLPLALALSFRLAHRLYYAGLGMLIYFSHGATEAYVSTSTRAYAAAQIAFTLAYFGLLLLIRRRSKVNQAREKGSAPAEVIED